MFYVVIVDDDLKMQSKVKKLVGKVLFDVVDEVKIFKFEGYCNELKKVINEKGFRKIYIMDIQLKNNESGVMIAKMIRETDWDSQIIFITDHDKMFETVYRTIYNVFDFVEKFHDFDNRLENDLKKIVNMNFDNKMFKYSSRNIDLQIYYKNILYIYRDTIDRKLVLVSEQNRFVINLSLHEITEMLDDRFVMVHRACIVNKDRVQEFNWSEKYFKLDNGEIVNMLSKKFRKNV